MSAECWAAVKGYEGLYAISDRGRVMSFNSNPHRRPTSDPLQILKPWTIKKGKGYYCVRLTDQEGTSRKFLVSRLVAYAFLGKANGREVNHVNGIPTDNCLDNIEYATHEENIQHCWRTGLSSNFGDTHYDAKLTGDQVKIIREEYARGGVLHRELADRYGVHKSNIQAIIKRRSWKHL